MQSTVPVLATPFSNTTYINMCVEWINKESISKLPCNKAHMKIYLRAFSRPNERTQSNISHCNCSNRRMCFHRRTLFFSRPNDSIHSTNLLNEFYFRLRLASHIVAPKEMASFSWEKGKGEVRWSYSHCAVLSYSREQMNDQISVLACNGSIEHCE